MINIAVCDDERIITDDISGKIKAFRNNCSVDSFNSARELLKSWKSYDIIFLDIEMPQMNGMEAAKLIRKQNKNTYIIFLTSHTECMVEAFKVRAYRFLVKPVSEEDLYESVAQAELELMEADRVMVRNDDRTVMINTDDIVCIEAFGDGSLIYTSESVKESNKSLKYWSEYLPCEYFYRVHKTYLAAFRYVETIEGSYIKLRNVKQDIPVSRRNQSSFRKAFFEYVKKNSKFI